MSSSRDEVCGRKMLFFQFFDGELAWRRLAAAAFLAMILAIAVHAPAGAQSVEEKQEQEYLDDIIRKDEDVSTKSDPRDKGREKSGDSFTEDPADESSKTLSPEDREKVRVQDDLLGDDDNQLTQEQKHQADVYVSAQLDRKIEKVAGKVPDEEIEHYLDYTPSPEARGNPGIKAYERKLWQESVRDYKSARLQEQLLAELDGPSGGGAGTPADNPPAGSGSGGAGGGLPGIGSLAELFGRPAKPGSGSASGADEPAKSPDTQDSPDTAEQAAAKQPANPEQQQAQPENQPLDNRALDASLPGNAESDPSATVPATPSKPSAAFSEVVAQSGIAEAEDGQKVEDGPQDEGRTKGPSAAPADRTADAEDTSLGSTTGTAPESPAVQAEAALPGKSSTSPSSAAGGAIEDGAPSPEDVTPEMASTENVSPEDTSLASAGSGRSGNFARQFSLDEELGAVSGSAADKPGKQNQESGGSDVTETTELAALDAGTAEDAATSPDSPTADGSNGSQAPRQNEDSAQTDALQEPDAEGALPQTAAQPQQQRLEETLATLKWQRSLADPEKAAGDPLSEEETAAIRRAGERVAQNPERAERLGQDVQARETLLEDLQQDAEAIEAEIVDAEASRQNATLQAALTNAAELSEGRLQYRPASATPGEPLDTTTVAEPAIKGAEEITLESRPVAGNADPAPMPRRESFLSRLQQDLQRLRLRLLHDQADSFLWECHEPSCSLPGEAGPVDAAEETGQQRSQP